MWVFRGNPMSAVQSIQPGGCVAPRPASRVVDVKVTSNDPTMRAEASRDGMVQISGKASNTGFMASTVTFRFDGHVFEIGLSGGVTGKDVQQSLKEMLPPGYTIQPVPTFAATDDALFRIISEPNNPSVIAGGFSKAHTPGTHAGVKVSVTELRSIVKAAKEDGFTTDEKTELARQWAGGFTGAGYNATEAAQKEYAKLQQEHALPVFPVR